MFRYLSDYTSTFERLWLNKEKKIECVYCRDAIYRITTINITLLTVGCTYWLRVSKIPFCVNVPLTHYVHLPLSCLDTLCVAVPLTLYVRLPLSSSDTCMTAMLFGKPGELEL